MTIHELYNKRQQEYMDYQVKKGIYDSKLAESKANLLSTAESLRTSLDSVENYDIKTRLTHATESILQAGDELSEAFLNRIKEELESISNSIEQEIRRVLE